MMRVMRFPTSDRPSRQTRVKRPAAALVLLAASLGSGCSADVGRFDFPGFSLTDKDGSTASIPRPIVPMRSGGSSLIDSESSASVASSGPGYVPPASRDGGVRMAALPDPARAEPAPAPLPAAASSRPAPPPLAERPSHAPSVTGGETIEVQSGDTLYGLSRQHKVPLSELMKANGLTGPALKPGQKLVLPASGTRMKPGYRTRPAEAAARATAAVTAAPAPKAPPAAAQTAANWDGTYTVKSGDSIYALARQYKVSQTELAQVNGITDPRRVRPGTTLKVPAEHGGASHVAAAPSTVAPASAAPARVEPVVPPAEPPRAIPSTTQPTIINGERKYAARTDTASDAAPADTPAASEPAAQPSKGEKTAAAGGAAASSGKLRWPVKGKILTAFGPRSDGTHNDGVNVSVPLGTEVHAAEGGVVAYAGSELKGYGNLILIRHDNGWVTAYAHTEEILVKRGDRVKRGQIVAKAGKSGQVDQPQLHFELRQGSKPVDPTPFMERM